MTLKMATGHRPGSKLNPEPTFEAMVSLLSSSKNPEVVSGGADGVDRLWARAAFRLDVPYDVWVPNGYQKNYQLGVWFDHMCHHARNVHLTQVQMGQPNLPFSPRLNFVRNVQMVEVAEDHIICSYKHPTELIKDPNGGTRHCAKEILNRNLSYTWINTLTGDTIHIDPPSSPITLDFGSQ